MREITQEYLHEIFSYDGEHLIWKKILPYAKHNGVGTVAGYKHNAGYWRITFNGKQHLAHRLIWVYVHGYWPTGEIDHINRNRLDNRIENIRDVDRVENARNTGTRIDNKTGVPGVSITKQGNYQARIKDRKKHRCIGTFQTLDEATKTRCMAEERYW